MNDCFDASAWLEISPRLFLVPVLPSRLDKSKSDPKWVSVACLSEESLIQGCGPREVALLRFDSVVVTWKSTFVSLPLLFSTLCIFICSNGLLLLELRVLLGVFQWDCVCRGAVNCYIILSPYIALSAHSHYLPLLRCDLWFNVSFLSPLQHAVNDCK